MLSWWSSNFSDAKGKKKKKNRWFIIRLSKCWRTLMSEVRELLIRAVPMRFAICSDKYKTRGRGKLIFRKFCTISRNTCCETEILGVFRFHFSPVHHFYFLCLKIHSRFIIRSNSIKVFTVIVIPQNCSYKWGVEFGVGGGFAASRSPHGPNFGVPRIKLQQKAEVQEQ